MRPIDSGSAATAGGDPFDLLLAGAFAAEPGPSQLTRMDERIHRALELGPGRVGRRPMRRTAWVLIAAATLLVIGGAGTIALQRFEGWSAPDFDVAWERGAVLGLTDEVDGYEVTLERAYADAGQVMLAVAIEDLRKRAGTTQLTSFDGTLVDGDGREFIGMGGQGGPVDAHESAELWYFDPPAFPLEPGPRQFTLTLDQIELRDDTLDGGPGTTAPPIVGGPVDDPWRPIKGSWVFEFELDVEGGTFVETDLVAAGPREATITIDSFLVSPTRAMLAFRVGGLPDPGAWWPVEISARRGSTTLLFGGGQTLEDGANTAFAYQGRDDASGTWIVTIGELVGPPPPGAPVQTPDAQGMFHDRSQRLRGPWTVTVEVP